jgi:hypothetical protein
MTTSSSVPDNGGDHSGGGGSAGGYGDDVFSTYLFTGDGGSIDVVNGVDLSGEGGMVWTKVRNEARYHTITDTERGAGKRLIPNGTGSENSSAGTEVVTQFNSDGFVYGNGYPSGFDDDYVSWTFRKAPKFFDVVTYTGDGAAVREIPHSLGVEPGMMIVKCTNNGSSWMVYHQGLGGSNYYLYLNAPDGRYNNSSIWPSDPTDSVFTVGSSTEVNADGYDYVAYLFAHDDSDESMIKCGSYTGNGNADGPEIDLGWEPQYILIKCATNNGDWIVIDSQRGMVSGGQDVVLRPNQSNGEFDYEYVTPLCPGFQIASNSAAVNTANVDYIYMAIRRPNKPADEFEPEELFAIDTGVTDRSPNFISGFPVGMAIHKDPDADMSNFIGSRPTQGEFLVTDDTDAAADSSTFFYDYQDGWRTPTQGGRTSWMWRRAPGFFDVVAYEAPVAVGSPYELPHNLGVKPEMMWVKRREWEREWYVYAGPLGAEKFMHLDMNTAAQDQVYAWNDTEPTDTHFTVGSNLTGVNQQYITYLFASVPGICDIGSYTGNGGDLDIDCGFTSGARFVLIKRTDFNGDWMHFDTERGISSTDSPMLKLNETDAQVSGSYIKPHSNGFTATSNLVGIVGAEYIYMAIA